MVCSTCWTPERWDMHTAGTRADQLGKPPERIRPCSARRNRPRCDPDSPETQRNPDDITDAGSTSSVCSHSTCRSRRTGSDVKEEAYDADAGDVLTGVGVAFTVTGQTGVLFTQEETSREHLQRQQHNSSRNQTKHNHTTFHHLNSSLLQCPAAFTR